MCVYDNDVDNLQCPDSCVASPAPPCSRLHHPNLLSTTACSSRTSTEAVTPSPAGTGTGGAGGATLSPDAPPGATLAPSAAAEDGSVERGFGAATLSPDAPPGATLAPLAGDENGDGLVNSADTGIVGDTNGKTLCGTAVLTHGRTEMSLGRLAQT